MECLPQFFPCSGRAFFEGEEDVLGEGEKNWSTVGAGEGLSALTLCLPRYALPPSDRESTLGRGRHVVDVFPRG